MKETIELGNGGPRPILSLLWGRLLVLTGDTVKFYRSDLYYDALWMEEYANEPCEFYFGTRETGTQIGTDEDLIREYNEHIYKVTVTSDDLNRWVATITEE